MVVTGRDGKNREAPRQVLCGDYRSRHSTAVPPDFECGLTRPSVNSETKVPVSVTYID